MSRQIKFRVWDKTVSKFLFPWVNGCRFGEKVSLAFCDFPWEIGELKDSNRFIIGEYTGLKDKNGREIYEGDILEDENSFTYEVFWLDTNASFELAEKQEKLDGYNSPVFHWRSMNRLRVIGNIFENARPVLAPNQLFEEKII